MKTFSAIEKLISGCSTGFQHPLTLQDMIDFAAGEFAIQIQELEKWRHILLKQMEAEGKASPADPVERKAVAHHVSALLRQCNNLGLEHEERMALQILRTTDQVARTSGCDRNVLAAQLEQLTCEIALQFKSHRFFFMPATAVKLYTEPPWPESVTHRFPKATREMTEAGKCLACENYGGSVTHCMKVLEFGLRALARRLKVKIKNPNWGGLIPVCEGAIEKLNKANPRAPHWRKNGEFIEGAAIHFKFLRQPWRNHNMHARNAIYHQDEAQMVFDHTRRLMIHLAQKLRE
jgi:hypothetical protein